jgi:hypothetical protein
MTKSIRSSNAAVSLKSLRSSPKNAIRPNCRSMGRSFSLTSFCRHIHSASGLKIERNCCSSIGLFLRGSSTTPRRRTKSSENPWRKPKSSRSPSRSGKCNARAAIASAKHGAYVELEMVNRLARTNPDALALLSVLKAHNGPNSVLIRRRHGRIGCIEISRGILKPNPFVLDDEGLRAL